MALIVATRRRLGTGLLLASLFIGLGAPGARAVTFDPTAIDIALRPVGSGFDNPTLVTNAGDGSGRLFVVEQTGYVRNLASGPAGTPIFLDVHTRTDCCGERGLLGLAFHPGFETNGKLYVNYTRASDGATIIDEYRVTSNPNNVDESATRRQILTIGQPFPKSQRGRDRLRAGRLPLHRDGRRR